MRSLARVVVLGPVVMTALLACLITLAAGAVTTLLGFIAAVIDEELS